MWWFLGERQTDHRRPGLTGRSHREAYDERALDQIGDGRSQLLCATTVGRLLYAKYGFREAGEQKGTLESSSDLLRERAAEQ
jgi:hypothetical protein